MRRDMDRYFRRKAVRSGQRGGDQATRPAPERDGGDLLDARERDRHQRDEQDDAKPEREGGAEHEIVVLPEGEDRGEPGADHVGRNRKRDSLAGCGAASRQDRQRQQQAEQNRETAELPMVGVVDQSGPAELGVARGIKHAPIHADAAFVGLPWLVEGLDDVVVDAIRLGARDEIAQHGRLLDASGIGA